MEIFLVRTSLACSRLSDSGEDAKEKGTRKVGKKKKGRESFLPFYFRVSAFSIQRTRLSRSLEQTRTSEAEISNSRLE